jgi:hypothetical protein
MHIVSVTTYSVAGRIDTGLLTIYIVAETIYSVTFTLYSGVLIIYSGVLIIHIPTEIIVPATLNIYFVAKTIVETVATMVITKDFRVFVSVT